jgi:Zn-finger protein
MTWTPFYISTNNLGAFVRDSTGTNVWTVREDPSAWQSATAGVALVQFNILVIH